MKEKTKWWVKNIFESSMTGDRTLPSDQPVHILAGPMSQEHQVPPPGNEKQDIHSSINSQLGSEGEDEEKWKPRRQELIIMGTMAVLSIVVSVRNILYHGPVNLPRYRPDQVFVHVLVRCHYSRSRSTSESPPCL